MLEKRILINEAGDPIMEIKTDSYTVVRRALNEEELVAFNAQQKETLPNEADVVTEAPVKEAPKAKAVAKAKAKKPAAPAVGEPVE
jgi:hypothetical protein